MSRVEESMLCIQHVVDGAHLSSDGSSIRSLHLCLATRWSGESALFLLTFFAQEKIIRENPKTLYEMCDRPRLWLAECHLSRAFAAHSQPSTDVCKSVKSVSDLQIGLFAPSLGWHVSLWLAFHLLHWTSEGRHVSLLRIMKIRGLWLMKAERAGFHVAVTPFLDKKKVKDREGTDWTHLHNGPEFRLETQPSAAESFRNSLPWRMLKGGTTSGGQCTCTSNVCRPWEYLIKWQHLLCPPSPKRKGRHF